MKIHNKICLALGLLAALQACSKAEEPVNRRGHSLLSKAAGEARDAEAGVIGADSERLSAISLLEARNAEAIGAEFVDNIQLVSKISEDQIIILGKDGRSWIYNPGDDAAPELIEAVTTPPSGQLYTLPEGQFWIVSNDSIGRRKNSSSEEEAGTVKAQSFSTSVLPGDKSKLRVLFAGPKDLILHLGTHIVVLSVQNDQIVNNPFALESMLPKLDGEIVAAGKADNGALWFAAGEKLILAEPKSLSYKWTGYHLPLEGHAGYQQLAMWLDLSGKGPKGDALVLDAGKIWSISGAPVAP